MTENPQAFPTHLHPESHDGSACAGMSLRDYFAGQALVSMGTWIPNRTDPPDDWPLGQAPNESERQRLKAEWAYQMADAMLLARKNNGSAS